jgi:hypothetical protein
VRLTESFIFKLLAKRGFGLLGPSKALPNSLPNGHFFFQTGFLGVKRTFRPLKRTPKQALNLFSTGSKINGFSIINISIDFVIKLIVSFPYTCWAHIYAASVFRLYFAYLIHLFGG